MASVTSAHEVLHQSIMPDDEIMGYGDDMDGVMLNRSTALAANTALTSVLIGTPAIDALSANTLLIAIATSNNELVVAINIGGNSREFLRMGGSTAVTRFNGAGADIDFIVEGDTNANLLTLDAGLDTIGIGIAAVARWFVSIGPSTALTMGAGNPAGGISFEGVYSIPANSDGAGLRFTIELRQADAGTHAIMAAAYFSIFAIAAVGATTTVATQIYIEGAPTGGGTTKYSIFVDGGNVRFDGDVLLDGTSLRANSATEIGISIRNTAYTLGSEGTLVIPIKTAAGEATDAQVGNIDGCIHYNTADNVLGVRDGVADNPVTVGLAGYVIQAYVPMVSEQRGWYHPNQLWNDTNERSRQLVDETVCTICGEDIVPNRGGTEYEEYIEQVVMVPNAYLSPTNAHPERSNVHAIFAHLHLERDRRFMEMERRVEELEQLLKGRQRHEMAMALNKRAA